MTFTLTEECLFCHKKRIVYDLDKASENHKFPIPLDRPYTDFKPIPKKDLWETQILVFYSRKRHDWEETDDKQEYRSGWVVTVCRECRKLYTVEQLIAKAKEVY